MLPILVAIGVGKLVGNIIQAVDDKNQHDKAAAEELRRARISEELARDAYERGKFTAGLIKMKATRASHSAYTNAAARGLDPEVSAQAIQAGALQAGGLDEALTMANAAREAWGHSDAARQHRQKSRDIKAAGDMRLAGNLIGLGTDVASMGYGIGKEMGLFGKKGLTANMDSGETVPGLSSDSVKNLARTREYRRKMKGAGDFTLDEAFGVV